MVKLPEAGVIPDNTMLPSEPPQVEVPFGVTVVNDGGVGLFKVIGPFDALAQPFSVATILL